MPGRPLIPDRAEVRPGLIRDCESVNAALGRLAVRLLDSGLEFTSREWEFVKKVTKAGSHLASGIEVLKGGRTEGET